MEHIFIPPTGALESAKDKRTVKHEEMTTMAGAQDVSGGYDYEPMDIGHQHKVGICTAISLTQAAEKAIGIKFSPDFQYLLQKKYVDGNWSEGSAIFSALKVGKNYGFLPIELFPYVTEADRNLSYVDYVAKLQAIPEADIQRLILACSDYKLTGYAQVNEKDSSAIAKAINDSKSGVLCRYDVGSEWYTAKDGRISWSPADINPIQPPKTASSGHAIIYAKYDFSNNLDGVHANTWGTSWNKEGLCDIIYSDYKPTECWIPYFGMTEAQLDELKAKLQQNIEDLKKKVSIWQQIKELQPLIWQQLKGLVR